MMMKTIETEIITPVKQSLEKNEKIQSFVHAHAPSRAQRARDVLLVCAEVEVCADSAVISAAI